MNIYKVSDGVFNGEYNADSEDCARNLFVREFYGFKPRHIALSVVQITTLSIEV